MAFTGNFICTSFKEEVLKKEHDLLNDAIKMALYSDSASLDADTTAYSTTNEISGTNYVAGGETMTSPVIATNDGVAYLDFDNVTWSSGAFTARGALIYNDTHASKAAIAVLDFGSNKTCADTDFTVTLPAAAKTTALIRIK